MTPLVSSSSSYFRPQKNTKKNPGMNSGVLDGKIVPVPYKTFVMLII